MKSLTAVIDLHLIIINFFIHRRIAQLIHDNKNKKRRLHTKTFKIKIKKLVIKKIKRFIFWINYNFGIYNEKYHMTSIFRMDFYSLMCRIVRYNVWFIWSVWDSCVYKSWCNPIFEISNEERIEICATSAAQHIGE
jgi:hypothetical protein